MTRYGNYVAVHNIEDWAKNCPTVVNPPAVIRFPCVLKKVDENTYCFLSDADLKKMGAWIDASCKYEYEKMTAYKARYENSKKLMEVIRDNNCM